MTISGTNSNIDKLVTLTQPYSHIYNTWLSNCNNALIVKNGSTTVDNCLFTGVNYSSIVIDGDAGISSDGHTTNVVITRCFMFHGVSGIECIGTNRPEGIMISNCLIAYCHVGIRVENTPVLSMAVNNCVIDQCIDDGIHIHRGITFNISNSYIGGNGTNTSMGSAINITGNAENIKIINCQLGNAGTGIKCDNVPNSNPKYISIINCYDDDNTSSTNTFAVNLDNADYVRIIACDFNKTKAFRIENINKGLIDCTTLPSATAISTNVTITNTF